MTRCALLLTFFSLGWLAGCGGGPVHRAFELYKPVLLSCSSYHLENGQWPDSKEDLVSFHAGGDFQTTPQYARLSRSDRKALSALDWQRYHNMTFELEGGDLHLRFDYRDERRGIHATGLRFVLHHTGHRWGPAP